MSGVKLRGGWLKDEVARCAQAVRRWPRPFDLAANLRAQFAEKDAEIARLNAIPRAEMWCQSCGTVTTSGECDCTQADHPETQKLVNYAEAMRQQAREQFEECESLRAEIARLTAERDAARREALEKAERAVDRLRGCGQIAQDLASSKGMLAVARAVTEAHEASLTTIRALKEQP